jgi:predicted 2-oxoglutarate/Fe(II)-dependent dioxygenase YbiX
MEVKEFIKIYDDVISLTPIANLIKWANTQDFEYAKILMNEDGVSGVDKKTRNTKNLSLSNQSDSMTNVHYCMLIARVCSDYIKRYEKDLNLSQLYIKGINDLQLLKYETGGFYDWHTDHAGDVIPRTLSCILFLNDDYEGGELMFQDPQGKNEITIKPKSARLIIWPSNFMYPHTVKPVTTGLRYSIVAWAI